MIVERVCHRGQGASERNLSNVHPPRNNSYQGSVCGYGECKKIIGIRQASRNDTS